MPPDKNKMALLQLLLKIENENRKLKTKQKDL